MTYKRNITSTKKTTTTTTTTTTNYTNNLSLCLCVCLRVCCFIFDHNNTNELQKGVTICFKINLEPNTVKQYFVNSQA